MAKIDTSKIENYANMSAEEKLAALEAFEYEAENTDAERLKAAVSKANSEAAEWKKKHNALLSEEQQKEAARLEAEKAIKDELKALRKENSITKSKAEFLALGYDDKLAGEAATALADGDMAKFNAAQKSFIENVKKAERAAALANDPKPPAGGSGGAKITKEQFDAMGYSERLKVFNEQPELFKQFTEG